MNQKSLDKTTNVVEFNPRKGWIPATQVPYYPSILEKFKHFLGFHCWTDNTPPCGNPPRMCLICFKKDKL